MSGNTEEFTLGRKFGTHAVSALVSSIIAKGIGLILVKILTNTLPKEDFGLFSIWISFAFLAATFSTTAFSASMWRFLPRRRLQDSDDGVSRLIGASFIGSCVLLLVIYGGLLLLFQLTGIMIYSDGDYIAVLVFVAILSLCNAGVELILVISGAEQNSREILILNFSYYAISTLSAVVAASLFHNYRDVILWLSVGFIVPVGITLVVKLNKYSIRVPQRADFGEIFRFGGPSVVMGSVVTLQPFLTAYFVGIYLGTSEIGSLVIALSLSTLFAFVISPPLTAYQSYLFNAYEAGSMNDADRITTLTMRFFLVLSILIGWLTVQFSSDLILLLSSEQYLSGVLIVPFTVAASIMISFSIFAKARVDLAEKTHLTGASYLISALFLIAMCMVFVPTAGFYGIGLAILVQALVVVALLYFFGNKFIPLTIGTGFVLKWSASIVGLLLLNHIMQYLGASILIAAAGSSFAYSLVLFLSGAITVNDIREMKKMTFG